MIKLYREHHDKKALQILFLSNVGLVRYIVKDYVRKNGGDFEDFFQEGLIALLDAIKKFDSSKGTKLSIYIDRATRRNITRYNEIKHSLVAVKWTITRKKLQLSLLARISAGTKDNITENWIREFAEENPQYSLKDIRSVLSILLQKTHVSLNSPVSSATDKGLTLLDMFSDQKTDVEKTVMNKMEFLKIYTWTMKKIKNRKKFYKVIVRDRLFSFTPRTQADIAEEFNIPRQYISRAEGFITSMIKNQFPDHSQTVTSQ